MNLRIRQPPVPPSLRQLFNYKPSMVSQPPVYLRVSNLYFFLALIALAGAVAYGVFQYRIFEKEKQAMSDNSFRLAALTEIVQKAGVEFKQFAEERAKKQAELTKQLANILPQDENYTELTRQFDNYFAENDKVGNPFFQSSLRFGKGAPVADIASLSVLPISMNIAGTRDNFYRFLDFVNSSGSLETGTRIMDIHSIQLNFKEGGEVVKNPKQEINFTVEMNGYYQTPRTAR